MNAAMTDTLDTSGNGLYAHKPVVLHILPTLNRLTDQAMELRTTEWKYLLRTNVDPGSRVQRHAGRLLPSLTSPQADAPL